MTAGVGAAPTTILTGLACTPLDPVSAETQTRLKLDSPYELRQCSFQSGHDIRKGDLISLDGVDYPVRAVEDYDWRGGTYLRVVVEKVSPLS
uniref:Uncharacterized protein n=1 Tax=Hot spring virus BHS1 TaxID=2024351 RepID=A0A2U7PAH9_9VIRU|nr:hypothetical protein [Hot spring virus BHS1]